MSRDLDQMLVFDALSVTQPIGTFYITSMEPAILDFLSFSDERRLLDEEFEEYIGIQRVLDLKRVGQLQKYVNTIDAAFPTGIIIAIDKDASYSEVTKQLILPNRENIARVLDGQHRIAGLRALVNEPFELPVVVFIDTDLEDQAHLFATINLAQTKVSASLAYELYDLASKRSPQKTCHVAAKILNGTEGSPLFHNIKILGKGRSGRFETLTQANIVEQLLKFITSDAMADRNALRQDLPLPLPDEAVLKKHPFRRLFVTGKDTEICANVWNFFKAVERRWPDVWDSQDEGIIIRRSTGFISFMRLLKASYLTLSRQVGQEVVRADQFGELLSDSPLSGADFNKLRYIPGSGGVSSLTKDLIEYSGLVSQPDPSFD